MILVSEQKNEVVNMDQCTSLKIVSERTHNHNYYVRIICRTTEDVDTKMLTSYGELEELQDRAKMILEAIYTKWADESVTICKISDITNILDL
jgi:hypothetical protein